MARHDMNAERAYFYWMPMLLDAETRGEVMPRLVPRPRRGGLVADGQKKSIKFLKESSLDDGSGLLEEAVEYLERAVDADPLYVPARVNLAVAYLYLGRPHQLHP